MASQNINVLAMADNSLVILLNSCPSGNKQLMIDYYWREYHPLELPGVNAQVSWLGYKIMREPKKSACTYLRQIKVLAKLHQAGWTTLNDEMWSFCR